MATTETRFHDQVKTNLIECSSSVGIVNAAKSYGWFIVASMK